MRILWHSNHPWPREMGSGCGITDENYEQAKMVLFKRYPSDAAAEQAARDMLKEIERRQEEAESPPEHS